MVDFVEDFISWPTMVELAGCLCTTVVERGLPALCLCAPVPGPMAVMEMCGQCKGTGKDKCGGQGWVRFVNQFPSNRFPAPDTLGASCNSPMAYMLEIGIARCVPTGTANGITGYTPPDLEALVDATRLQMADKAAMLAALQCCLDSPEKDLTYSIGTYSTLQAAGDCGGGFWTVTVWSV
jgi:hypothetical protein